MQDSEEDEEDGLDLIEEELDCSSDNSEEIKSDLDDELADDISVEDKGAEDKGAEDGDRENDDTEREDALDDDDDGDEDGRDDEDSDDETALLDRDEPARQQWVTNKGSPR